MVNQNFKIEMGNNSFTVVSTSDTTTIILSTKLNFISCM